MGNSITLSKKYGVNPSVEKCAVCGKDMSVVLFGTSWKCANGKTAEAPMEVCLGNLCDDCKKIVDQGGVFIIEVRDGESGNNPYRTGRPVAIKRESAERMLKEVHPIAYMEQSNFEPLFGEYCKNGG